MVNNPTPGFNTIATGPDTEFCASRILISWYRRFPPLFPVRSTRVNMTRTSKKGTRKNKSARRFKKEWKTKRFLKDIDQIHDDMKSEEAPKLLNQEINFDLPGAAQFYCIHCA